LSFQIHYLINGLSTKLYIILFESVLDSEIDIQPLGLWILPKLLTIT